MFIVLEGIDGAGGGTQRKMLEKYYSDIASPSHDLASLDSSSNLRMTARRFKKVLTLKYPYYEDPIGVMIKDFLYSDVKLPPEKQFLLFFSQWALESPRIEEARKNGLVIADRWVTSGMVYQGIQGVPLSDLVEANRIFKLAVPDAFFFLDVPVAVAAKRDMKGEEGEEGRFEKKKDFLGKCYQQYRELMHRQVIAPWQSVDGTEPIEEVTKKLIEKIDAII